MAFLTDGRVSTAPPVAGGPAPAQIQDRAAFEYIRALLREHSAMVVDESKAYLVAARVAPVMKRHGIASMTELVTHLRGNAATLRTEVVDAMTINETLWFRDIHPFETLRTSILPDAMRRRATERTLTIWSAACSSGQEPYTIAILLREHFPELAGWNVRIIGTDLSGEMLAKAVAGIYTQTEMNRGMPAKLLVKYFQRVGAEWQIAESIRSMVEFRTLNLARPWPPVAPADIVFLRNVLIYFDVDTKRVVLDRVRGILRPGGALFLGAAETTLGIHQSFVPERHGSTTVYRTT